MAKKTQKLTDKPIAARLLARMKLQWQRKVVNIRQVIAGRAMADEPQKTVEPGPRQWLAYFKRALPEPVRVRDYARHMKYGPTREYWNDFVFEAYVNHRQDAIYLAGLPDVPESRPHSKVNGWGFGR